MRMYDSRSGRHGYFIYCLKFTLPQCLFISRCCRRHRRCRCYLLFYNVQGRQRDAQDIVCRINRSVPIREPVKYDTRTVIVYGS